MGLCVCTVVCLCVGTWLFFYIGVLMCRRSWLCGSFLFFFLFWHSLSTGLVKHPSISRQYSGELTPCQEQFGASAKISSCRGAVMEEKSKTPTWLAVLPPSWKTGLVTWPDFTRFTAKPQQKMEELPTALQYGVISCLAQAKGCVCHTAYAIQLKQ